MTGLSTSIVAHKLPINPTFPSVKQKLRKIKPDMSLKIKEEVTKKVKAKVLRVVEYTTWLSNIVPLPKKDGKGMYCYNMILFGLKNAGATYMRSMTTIFHDMIHKEIDVYVDEVIIKSKKATDHIEDLRKFFNRLRRYNLKLNPAKCSFGVPAGKLLGFIVSFAGEDIAEPYDGWRMFFDGASNFKRVGIGAILVSESGQHYPVSAKLRFPCTNNMAEYESCILGLKMTVDINIQELLVIGDSDLLIHQNEFTDALATLSSMIQNPDKIFIDLIPVKIHDQPAYCAHVEEEADGKPWFHDIWEYLAKGEYPGHVNPTRKCTLQRLSNNFFHNRGIMCRKTPDLRLLRCVDSKEASKLLDEIHAGTCGPHMNGFVLEKKILRASYFWITMETDCIQYVRKCHRYQIHGDMIKGYRTTVRTSTGATPYMLVYGTETVIPAEVEIPSLRIIQEAELNDAEWVKSSYEQLKSQAKTVDTGAAGVKENFPASR
ncbi:uncharacterized protein [Nicotiana sylvestris]|uniref:uncharacterized protein n=1 Tax=Nicotiana sylvestris TaxID=4096 RepID=UPI00388C5ECE